MSRRPPVKACILSLLSPNLCYFSQTMNERRKVVALRELFEGSIGHSFSMYWASSTCQPLGGQIWKWKKTQAMISRSRQSSNGRKLWQVAMEPTQSKEGPAQKTPEMKCHWSLVHESDRWKQVAKAPGHWRDQGSFCKLSVSKSVESHASPKRRRWLLQGM